MGPRKGGFNSNKVRPFKNHDEKKPMAKSFRGKVGSPKPRSSFFVKPSTSKRGNSFRETATDKDELFVKPSASRGNSSPNEKDDFFVSAKPKPSTSSVGADSKHDFEIEPSSLREKKPFDKKKWRLQRYSKKYKLQQWEDKRKKTVLREFYRQIDDRPKYDVKKIYEEAEREESSGNRSQDTIETDVSFSEVPQEEESLTRPIGEKKIPYWRARSEQFERLEEANRKLTQETGLKRKEQNAEVRKREKAERLQKFKKLSRKTKKGQPIMKDRMELLLEQIQKSVQK